MNSIKTVNTNGTIIYKNENGNLHREDGPAYIGTGGYKAWFINGVRHREDGPASVYSDGVEIYYLNGKEYSKEGYESKLLTDRLERLKDL